MQSTETATPPGSGQRRAAHLMRTTLAVVAFAALAMLGCDQSDGSAARAGCAYEELGHAAATTAMLSCTTTSSELRSITITFECVADDATPTGTGHRTTMVLNDQPFWDTVFTTRVRSFTIHVREVTEKELWATDDAFIQNRFARVDPTLTSSMPQAIANGTSTGLAVNGYGGTIPVPPPTRASAQRWMKVCDILE